MEAKPPSEQPKPPRDKAAKSNRGLPLKGYEMPTVLGHETELYALQACAAGTATPHQAKLAIEFIIERVANTYGWAYCPLDVNLTHVTLGRQYVGASIVGWLKINLHKLGGNDEPTEHGN